MDDIDTSNEAFQSAHDKNIAAIRAKASNIPKGYAGTCEICESESPRLVNGECVRCRDLYK